MEYLRKKKHAQPKTADDLEKLYLQRIDQFFERNDASSPIRLWTTNPLEKLLGWGKDILQEKEDAQRALHDSLAQYRALEDNADKLNNALEATQAELHSVKYQKKELQSRYHHDTSAWQERYDRDLLQMATDHDIAVDKMRRAHKKEIDRLESVRLQEKRRYEDTIEALTIQHEETIHTLQTQHKKEQDRLLGQVLTNTDDSTEWPDDKLKWRFSELQRLVDSITSPQRNEFRLQSKEAIGNDLDPTGFIRRGGYPHLLLKYNVWAILVDQFFAAPFGFGAFGPKRGQSELLRMYGSWRSLFDSRISSSPDVSTLKVFENDRLANRWRTATFQSLSSINTNSDTPIARLRKENVDTAISRILRFLSEFASRCNSVVSDEAQNEIKELANLGIEFGLQIGVQPAYVRLLFPSHGESITIGADYQDTQDGDDYKGQTFNVDLVTAAGLQKIGDGRADTKSKRTILACQVWTNQE